MKGGVPQPPENTLKSAFFLKMELFQRDIHELRQGIGMQTQFQQHLIGNLFPFTIFDMLIGVIKVHGHLQNGNHGSRFVQPNTLDIVVITDCVTNEIR